MTFKGKELNLLTNEDVTELIERWIEFKLKERELVFTLIGSYTLIFTQDDVRLQILEDNNLNIIQHGYLQTYQRIIENGDVTFEQMINELNGIKY